MTPSDLATWVLLGGFLLVAVAVVALVVAVVALIFPSQGRPSAAQIAPASAEQANPTAAGQPTLAAAEQAKLEAEQTAQKAQRHAQTGWQWYEAAVREMGQLVDRLRAVSDIEARRYTDVTVPPLLHSGFADQPLNTHVQAAEQVLREAVQTTRVRTAASARAGVVGTSDEVQMFLTRLQTKIDEALDKLPPDSPYLHSLTGIDHEATRARHSVQRLRILAGSWPGNQRANCTFLEIVESARSRIGPYDRVRYNYRSQEGETWVVGRVVEPITVMLTELLANATSYSSDHVDVHIEHARTGYRIMVEDYGLGMNTFQLEEAERLLSHRTELDVASLHDERKLGFAVIGSLAHQYGLHVEVRARSAEGGIQAILLIPHTCIMAAPPTHDPIESVASQRNVQPQRGQQPAVASSAANGHATTSMGLPKRQRRSDSVPSQPAGVTQEAITDTLTPEAASAGMARLSDTLSQGFGTTDNDIQGHPQP